MSGSEDQCNRTPLLFLVARSRKLIALRSSTALRPRIHLRAIMRSHLAPSTASPATRMSSTKASVFSRSRQPSPAGNGTGLAGSKLADPAADAAETRTVILSPQQLELMNNNVVPTSGLVTVPVPTTSDKVFECLEESLFYCQCIEGMVLNRCGLRSGITPPPWHSAECCTAHTLACTLFQGYPPAPESLDAAAH